MPNYRVSQISNAASCWSSRVSSCFHSGESGCWDGEAVIGHRQVALPLGVAGIALGQAIEDGEAGLGNREPPGRSPCARRTSARLPQETARSRCQPALPGSDQEPDAASLAFTKSQRLEGKVGRSSGEGF